MARARHRRAVRGSAARPLSTGWFAADAAAAGPGRTVTVGGGGTVGLMGVLAARQMGAARIVLVSRHGRLGAQAAEGYRAMDERRAIKTLLTV